MIRSCTYIKITLHYKTFFYNTNITCFFNIIPFIFRSRCRQIFSSDGSVHDSAPTTPDTNSLPRYRSRIKTNPWLLSPVTSPCGLSRDTRDSRTFLVPLTKDTHYSRSRGSSGHDVLPPAQHTELPTTCRIRAESVTDSANYSDSSESQIRNDCSFDSLHGYDAVPYDSDHYSEIPDECYYKSPRNIRSKDQKLCDGSMDAIEMPRSYGIADFQALDQFGGLDISSSRVLPVYVDSNPPSPSISFEYEDEFESRVENSVLCNNSRDSMAGSLLLASDIDSDSLFGPPRQLHLKHLKKVYTDGNGYDSTATDDTLCGDYNKSSRKHRYKTECRIKRKLASNRLDTRRSLREDDNDADAEDNKDDGFSERTSSLADESFDSAIDSSMSTSDSPSTESPSADNLVLEPSSEGITLSPRRHVVQETLQQRVVRLRMEKEIVDEKIHQAREEEVYRQQERARLQREAAMQRKALLLQTLQDLKSKLEGQNQRLQNTYSTVLNMQKVIIRQKCAAQGSEHVATTCTSEELLF